MNPDKGFTNYIAAGLDRHPDYRVLRRLPAFTNPATTPGAEEIATWKHGIILDTETEGLEDTDKVVELGLKPFSFNARGEVQWAGNSQSFLEDPGKPLSDEVKRVTGLTDEMLAGKTFDDARIAEIINGAVIIICHNAKFDRPKAERRYPFLADKHWACSMDLIDWRAMGCPSASLPCIAWALGYFYDAHRADADCDALLSLLLVMQGGCSTDPLGQYGGLPIILENARKPTYRVWAVGSSFDRKDDLKRRGYKWHDGAKGRAKSWYRDLSDEAAADAELAWLQQEQICREPDVAGFTAKDRYTERTLR